jgi:alkylhydroperoxidase family enzyme
MSRVGNVVDGPTELDQVWNLRRRYFELFMSDYNASIGRLDPVLVELCRVRIAQLVESEFDQSLRYRPAAEVGLTEEKISALPDYVSSPVFSPRERAVLEFTEQWVIQSSTITDEDCERLQQHISVEEFIYLAKVLSVLDQFARANSALRIAPARSVSPNLPDFIVHQLPAA